MNLKQLRLDIAHTIIQVLLDRNKSSISNFAMQGKLLIFLIYLPKLEKETLKFRIIEYLKQ